jgi:hypothetical protein
MGEPQRALARGSALEPAARASDAALRVQVGREGAPLRHLGNARALQLKLALGAADDPYEREADRAADEVMSPGGAPGIGATFGGRPLAASLMRVVQCASGKGEEPTKKDDDERKKRKDSEKVQRDVAGAGGPDSVPTGIETSIQAMSAGGTPLPPSIRATFEPSFGYDFSSVRTHNGSEAAGAAAALGARAFTVGDHIFFAAGEYQPTSPSGQRLVAHELTHTIQQQPPVGRAARLLPAARRTVVRPSPMQAAPKRVQRIFDDVKQSIRKKVSAWIKNDFPPWDLITLIIGWDPIDEKAVKGSTREWIQAALKLVSDGQALFDKLDKEGKIDALAKWWDGEVAKLDLSMAKLVGLVKQAWDAVGASDLFDPFGAWNKKIKPIFTPVVERVWNFVKAVGGKVLQFVKEVVLKAIADWAKEQKGYTLLTFVLGKDPITGEEVKRTAKGLIFAVLDLVPDGDKIKENLEKSKTIEKAAAWFSEEVKQLDLTWEGIKLLFKQAWDAFKVVDLLAPRVLFEKMAAIFGPPLGRLLRFLIAVGKKVLELIFEGAMLIAGPIGLQIVGIIKKIGATFNKIIEDPVRFVGNLVQAVKLGLNQFAKNIWEHLKQGLIAWLVGGLEGAGLVLPKVWDLKGILDLVLQILGITYAKVRAKLVKVLGEDTVAMLEKTFDFLKVLVTEGPAAAWQKIVEAIGGLWDMVIGGIKDWAVTKIVTAAITKLVTMFNPAGAIIQAIIATYNTVAFFIERIRQILALVEAIVDSIASIAEGKLAQAANWVEKAMARTIPVILGFLARLIGLGDISGAVKKVITAIQEKVDKGIDAVIKWIVDKAKSLFGAGKADEAKAGAGAGAVADVPVEGGEAHTISVKEQGGQYVLVIRSAEAQIGAFLDAAEANPKITTKRKQKYLAQARANLAAVNTQLKALKTTTDEAAQKKVRASLLEAEKALAASIKRLLGGANMAKLEEKYLLEGVVKTYATLPKPSYDKLTPDHQPQAALVTLVAGVKVGNRRLFAGLGVQGIAANRAALGVAVNLHENRHYKSRTYGTPVASSVEDGILKIAGGTASDDAKRKKIIGVVQSELDADVKAIKNLVAKPQGSVWSDIDDVFKDDDPDSAKDDAKALKEEVAERIKSGENEVARQNLYRWIE